MIPLSLAELAAITHGVLDLVPDPQAEVRGPVVIDSRQVAPGGLFVALPGERADGHDFAAAAVAAGAVAVLASRPVGVPALIVPDAEAALAPLARAVAARLPQLTIAGITGSSGKTTTKDLLAQLAERLGPTVAPPGSFNNELGHPLTVLRADEQTRYLVLELGARGRGHIARLCAIAPPRLGAVLNVGRAHVGGYFVDQREVADAKGELVEALPAHGFAALNADDPEVIKMASRTAAHVIKFGLARHADVRAEGVTMDDAGRPSFTLVTPAGRAPVRLNLRGEHNVSNALAAAALAGPLGMTPGQVADGLSAAVARSGRRMEVTRRPDGVTVINDAYNANPDSMRAALTALASISGGGRGFAVLGTMAELGGNSAAWHEEIGAFAARLGVSALIVVGDEATPMLAGAKSQPGWPGELLAVPDGRAAAAALRQRIGPGDTVLVKASRSVGLWSVADELLWQAAS
ncbi:MAG TPA: UDP-N-acetylmuramoyl-tripeptide--D-alanyl-D-alanine ligase [Streptosporangiaceae bacterium]|jgi:UDP-N-acetylmuramoyl-tripeptide--D-alanyl-D-alanine ligase